MHAGQRSALHETIVQHVHDVITVVDADGIVRFINDEVVPRQTARQGETVGREALSWVHPDDRGLILEQRAWLRGRADRTSRTIARVRQTDGSWRHVETHGVNLLDDPEVRGLLYVTRDVEDRVQAEQALVRALAAQSEMADLGARALRSLDVDDVIEDALARTASLLSAPYVTLLLLADGGRLQVRLQHGPRPLPPGHDWPLDGTSAGAALAARSPTAVEDLDVDDRFRATAEQAEQGVLSGADVLLEGADGPLGVLGAADTAPRRFSSGDVQLLQGLANVVAGALEREQRERSALVQALHDPLTGLPTRPLFTDRLEHALGRVRRGSGEVAVMLVDLDRFKAVNDAWGHAAGDEVLRALGPRLAACARASDTVARYGGDEFVVLCEDDVTHLGVARVAAAVRRACAEPVVLATGESVLLSGSVGLAWSVEEGLDAQALLRAADAAMYRDKQAAAGL